MDQEDRSSQDTGVHFSQMPSDDDGDDDGDDVDNQQIQQDNESIDSEEATFIRQSEFLEPDEALNGWFERVEQLHGYVVSQIEVGGHHLAAITQEGDLFIWGSNECGQLGLGHTRSTMVPTLVDAFHGVPVIAVSCGERHTAAITANLDLYTWGDATTGQLGHGSLQRTFCRKPRFVGNMMGKKPVAVACGSDHTLVLLSNGEVWSTGNNFLGQLGHNDVKRRTKFERIQFFVDMHVTGEYIAASNSFSAVVDEDGQLYTFGDGSFGQHGDDSRDPSHQPNSTCMEHISHYNQHLEEFDFETPAHVTQVETCGNFVAVITRDNCIWTWGCSNGARLGHGVDQTFIGHPKVVQTLIKTEVMNFGCSLRGLFVLTQQPISDESIIEMKQSILKSQPGYQERVVADLLDAEEEFHDDMWYCTCFQNCTQLYADTHIAHL
eukprot:TRINITY_DN855_c0_g5_i2.p1 TRINITY_DN855_c0_g5~~TRINITY_DN855_c0_g5_i2.p1  ORF type:complete len:436 (-),score=110.78 TRINITY_DN855_c0_g5_i2:38-1345(-)